METKGNSGKMIKASKSGREIPVIQNSCIFTGYDAELLMDETEKLRELITKRGTLEILIPLCCTTDPVRYIKFRRTMKGFSSKTLAIRLKELEISGILERKAYNEIPPMRESPVHVVPISVMVMNGNAISVSSDSEIVNNHFGDSPIYGTVTKAIKIMK